jgi:hypothetical protein
LPESFPAEAPPAGDSAEGGSLEDGSLEEGSLEGGSPEEEAAAGVSAGPGSSRRRPILELLDHGKKRAILWLLGEEGARLFARRLQVRVSTLLIFAMAVVIFLTLVLSYWKTPEPGDPYFERRWAREGAGEGAREMDNPPSQSAGPPSSPLAASLASSPAPRVDKGSRELVGLARPLPLWSPSSATDLGAQPEKRDGSRGADLAGRGASLRVSQDGRRDPEIRNVEVLPSAAIPGAQLDPGAQAGGAVEPPGRESAQKGGTAEPASPYIYLIQVRAKESMEGAQRILEYLAVSFGLGPAYIERDLRGDHNAEGKLLYTAFVGPYFSRAEADRECERLKRETRRTPYKNKGDFFQDCLVITRTR